MILDFFKMGCAALMVSGFVSGAVFAADAGKRVRTDAPVKLKKGTALAEEDVKPGGMCVVYEKVMCEGYSRSNQCTLKQTDTKKPCDEVTVPSCIGCVDAGLSQTEGINK